MHDLLILMADITVLCIVFVFAALVLFSWIYIPFRLFLQYCFGIKWE